jgi:hypothetical protein
MTTIIDVSGYVTEHDLSYVLGLIDELKERLESMRDAV